jgi:hypothetical protein
MLLTGIRGDIFTKGLLKNNFPCTINAVSPEEKPGGTEENRAVQMESGEGNGSIRNSPV